MKLKISVLMDGELFEDEAASLLDHIKRGSDVHKDWEVYHLIGDVLRQPDHIHCSLSAKVRERLQDEPTVLAPRGRAVKQRMRTFALWRRPRCRRSVWWLGCRCRLVQRWRRKWRCNRLLCDRSACKSRLTPMII